MRTPQEWLAITVEKLPVGGVDDLGLLGKSASLRGGGSSHDVETAVFLDDVDTEGESCDHDEAPSHDDAYDEYREEQNLLGESVCAFDAEGVKDRSADGNPTAVSCLTDLYSESDEEGGRASVSAAGEGRSCCLSSEQENEDSDCESFGEEECSI